MSEGAATPARFVRAVGGVFLVAAVIGLLISGAQVVLLSRAAPGLAVDGTARAVALGLVALSSIVVVVSVAFLRRRRWARATLAAILALGIVASLTRLMLPAPPIEPPPAEAPAEYLRLLRLISLADVVVPIAACLAFGWILWRLRSPGVRDQFR
jgi:hypothetical protein